MKGKFLFIVILLAVAISAAQANNLVVGSTFGNSATKLTTFDYTIAQPLKGAWNQELTLGYATGLEAFNQNKGVDRYSVGLGLGVTNGFATVTGGYTIGYVDAKNVDAAFGGLYAKVDLKISKRWFVEAKYVNFFDTNVAEGWQGSIGFTF